MNRNRRDTPRDDTTRLVRIHAAREETDSWLRVLRTIRELPERAV